MKKYIVYILLCLNFTVFAQEEAISFEAKVSKDKLGVNERLRIDFQMNKDGDNFTPPNFEGFRVLMGPNQSISNSWINGRRTFSKSYSYILSPLSKGTFSIKQATVEIDGKTYKTLPVAIEVTPAVDSPNAERTADDVAEDNIHLVAEVSESSPYLNEAVSVVYKLYVSQNINVSNYDFIDLPKYNNFWSQSIDIKRLKPESGMYNGKRYMYWVMKKVVLYPQKTGKLEIEPLSMDITVDVPTNRRDLFGGRLYTQAHQTISTGTRTITVKELPLKGKPDDFSGAVGQFDFNVITSKTDLKAQESLTAKVEITGKGNLKLFEIPKLSLPASVEVFEPEFDESISTLISGMQGKVSDNYAIVPQYKGKFQIPPISFSYFDPKEERYKTLSSQEIQVNVFDGPSSGNTSTGVVAGNFKQQVQATGSAFRFLKLNANLEPQHSKVFFGSKLFYTLLLGPLLLIPLFIVAGKKKIAIEADVEGNRLRKANKLARKYLSEAKRNLGQKEAFYESLERALHNYLKAKLKIETSDFTKEKIQELLLSRKVNTENITDFIGLLNSCELARYSPASEVTMQQDYQKAAEVISQIDKQMKL